tara:strand:- start:200 stop:838 length:639 start_codon:yes stop_codon:yes gene_type:complete
MKSISTDQNIRDEYYRGHSFAVDLIELHLKTSTGADSPLYLASGGIDIAYDSSTAPTAGTNTYSAQGEFLGHSAITEEFDVSVGKFDLSLSGLPTGYIDKFQGNEPEGKRVVVHKVFLDLNTLDVINSNDSGQAISSIVMFDGQIFNVTIQESANSCNIGVQCASIFADFERSAGRKTTDWTNWLFQGTKYDTAFEKAGFVGNTEFLWGRNN